MIKTIDRKIVHGGKVHKVLAHSYVMHFILFLMGILFDFIFNVKVFNYSDAPLFGAVLILLATVLIIWAQHTSRHLDVDNLKKENFCRGPYSFSRSPTHWGLFFLIVGFGVMSNAIFVVLSAFISLLISRLFLGKEEEILAEKYGTPYLEYKKSVKL